MKNKRGISLIVLIITIIVVIILAAVVILTITNNNPISSANEAKFKSDIRTFQDDLSLTISKEYVEKQGQRDTKINADKYTKDNQIDSVYTHISSFKKEYEKLLAVEEDELVYYKDATINSQVITGVNDIQEKWLKELSVKASKYNKGSFDANAWDSNVTEEMEACFIWNEDKTVIIGFNSEAVSKIQKLIIPSRCKKIKRPYLNPNISLSGVEVIEIPETLTTIDDSAFHCFVDLKEIKIPESVTSIGSYAFWKCRNLTSITIPDGVKSIGEHFVEGCTNLNNIYVSDKNTNYSSLDGVLFNKNNTEIL